MDGRTSGKEISFSFFFRRRKTLVKEPSAFAAIWLESNNKLIILENKYGVWVKIIVTLAIQQMY